jgi:Mg-chelatase subunit ChlD
MPRKTKAQKRTHVAIVLDSSGSMDAMKDAAIELFNTQRDTIHDNQHKSGETKLSLVLFGTYDPTGVRVVHESACPCAIPRLDSRTYQPQASTPMRDAIGRAITLLEQQDDGGEDTAFLVITITDGQENSSREWSARALSSKTAALQQTGRWTFAVYGCEGLSLTDLRETVGFRPGVLPASNYMPYYPDAAGLRFASSAMVGSTVNFLSAREQGVTHTTNFTGGDEAPLTTDEN